MSSEKKYWTGLVFMFVIGMLIGAVLFFAGVFSGDSSHPSASQIILGITGLFSFFGCMAGMMKSVKRCVDLDLNRTLEAQVSKTHQSLVSPPLYQSERKSPPSSDTIYQSASGSPSVSQDRRSVLRSIVSTETLGTKVSAYPEYPPAIYGGSEALETLVS